MLRPLILHTLKARSRSECSRYASKSASDKKISKKKYEDLPDVLILENGTIATPLGDWKDVSASYKASLGFNKAEMSVPTGTTINGGECLTRRRKGMSESTSTDVASKTRKTRSKDAKSPEVKQDAEGNEVPQKRRRRKAPTEVSNIPLTALETKPQTQLARDILDNLARFPNCILLTRVGQFYESYFDQAPEVARLLGIKLASRQWGGSRVHMCGFPLTHLDRHLKVLVPQEKRFVALCEEFRRHDGLFDRRVVRVVTPGTLIDESFLNHYENNYLVSISSSPNRELGLAWIDVSTGEFFSQPTTPDGLRDDLSRIAPREVVLHQSIKGDPMHFIHQALREELKVSVTYVEPTDQIPMHFVPAEEVFDPQDVSAPPVYTPEETSAVQILTSFLRSHMLEHMPELPSPRRQILESRMQIDSHTIRALEIKQEMREGGVTGSLLSTIKRTTTNSGTRLLSRWLCSPSTSISEINARQALVAVLHGRPHLRADLVEMLRGIEDVTRIVQKFLYNKGDASDLVAVKDTVEQWNAIRERISLDGLQGHLQTSNDEDWSSAVALFNGMRNLDDLVKKIGMAVDGNDLKKRVVEATTHDIAGDDQDVDSEEAAPLENETTSYKRLGMSRPLAWSIKTDFSPEMKEMHERLNGLLDARTKLQATLQERFDAPSLMLKSSPPHGLYIHIGKAKRDNQLVEKDPEVVLIGQSNSTRSYFHREWAVLGSQIIETETGLMSAERRAFESLRTEVNAQSSALRRNARIMDELDVALGFADLAAEMSFVRPHLEENTSYHVVNGRHPTVELGLLDSGRTFTPNTVSIGDASRLHLITGPNMSGKSSLLRQTALIAILAQVGSFVPADSATIGIVDKVFSRVGAKDDLFRDRSTFMVEMLETAEILRRATERSLVIMDEVGRGTTVKDGMAIAFATVHHLYHVNRSRALFATHFHEIADMLGYSGDVGGPGKDSPFPNMGFFCTGVDELEDGRFAYSHRLTPGVNRDSHGLKVAQLAGMPSSVVDLASAALKQMKKSGNQWTLDKDGSKTLGVHLSADRKTTAGNDSPQL